MFQNPLRFKKHEGPRHYQAKRDLGSLFYKTFGYDVFYEVPSVEKIKVMSATLGGGPQDQQHITNLSDGGTLTALTISSEIKEYDYAFDLLLRIPGRKNYENRGFVVVEVDGKIGHTSAKSDLKDHRRDTHIFEKYGVPTVRLNPRDVVGAKKLSPEEIIDEYMFQLEGKEDQYKSLYCFSCKKFWYDREVCECGRKTYQRKVFGMPKERKKDDCTWCGHRFEEHTFSGCNPWDRTECVKCITGIIHSSFKKDG